MLSFHPWPRALHRLVLVADVYGARKSAKFVEDRGQSRTRLGLPQRHIKKLTLSDCIRETFEFKQPDRDRLGGQRWFGRRPLSDLGDLAAARLRPRLAHRRILQRERSQPTPENSVCRMVVDQGVGQPRARRTLGDQLADDYPFVAFPGPIDGQEDLGLVPEPTIEGLRRETGAPGDLVAIRTGIALLAKFGRRGGDQLIPGGLRQSGRVHQFVLQLTHCDSYITCDANITKVIVMAQSRVNLMIEIDGVNLAVDRIGHGPPVVCLHSVGHDSRDYDELLEHCGDAFEFILLDWPGHGRSGPDRLPTSAMRYAALADGLLSRFGVDRPLVIGNSIGGAAAITLASRRSLRGLVLCDSGGLVAVDGTVRAFCGVFERFFAAGERGAAWYPAAFNLYYQMVLPRPAAGARRADIVRNARNLAPLLRQAWASFGRPEADLRDAAAAIEIPVWVAWAKHDYVIPLNRVRPAINRLKYGRLSLFAGGHTPFLEEPDEFAAQFRRFAEGLS